MKNMPRAIDKRIVQEKPQLARAIAAEHLIQVFFTHKGKIEMADTMEDKDAARQSYGDVVEPLDQEEEDELLEAYRHTFDLLTRMILVRWNVKNSMNGLLCVVQSST